MTYQQKVEKHRRHKFQFSKVLEIKFFMHLYRITDIYIRAQKKNNNDEETAKSAS